MKKSKKAMIRVEEPSGINVKQLSYTLKKNRYRILAFGVIGVFAALLYNVFFPQKFNIATSVLVKTDNSQATLTSVHPDQSEDKKATTVLDQVGVLGSYTLNLQTLQNLNWNTSWFKSGFLVNKDLYKDEPFKLDTATKFAQLEGIPLKIKVINSQQYSVNCNSVREFHGIKHDVKFEGNGYFGKPFKNAYFDFTISNVSGREATKGDEFVLVFNDLTQLAKSYQEDLKITNSDEGSNLITIELASAQPDRAIDYLTELDKVYIKFGLTEKNRLAANTVKFINTEIAGISDSLQNSGNSVSNFRSSNNAIDVNQQSTAIVNNMDKVQGDIAAARMQLDYYSSLKRYLTNASAIKSLVAPSIVGVTDPTLNAEVSKLSDLFHQREVLSYTAQDKSPQMVDLDEEIGYTQKTLGENINNLVDNTRMKIQGLARQQQSINSEKAAIPKTEQNLNRIKRNFDFNNELYSYLLQKRSEAQIAEASRDPDAQILDQASFGTATPKGFNHSVNALIGFILGLLIPLFYYTAKTFFKKNLEYVSDVKELLQPAVVGTILYNKFENELPVLSYPHAEITESFRSLRINLEYLLKNLENKVISIHSSIAGEGKTFVSANLGAILALNNKTVLLVDADLRKPRTHLLFNSPNNKGLSTYLDGEHDFSEVVQLTKTKGLCVVTSGPKPDYPSELLGNGKFHEFISEAKKHYDYIIINNAPLNIVKDGMMVVPFSDINLFLLRMKKSTINQLEYINQLIQENVVKNVMVVLNNVTADSYAMVDSGDHGYYNDNRMLSLKQ